jgi:hypothetical protein
MFLIQSAYYGAHASFFYFGAHATNVMAVVHSANNFTDVIGAVALNVPSALGLPNTLCNDPLVVTLRLGLTTIIEVLTAFGVAIGIIGIIVGGLMRATAWGSEQRIAASNKAISSAIVGLIIVLIAVALGMAIPGWFGLQNSTCPLTPSSTPVATSSSSSTSSPSK